MAWRNGGGETVEIAAHPPGAALDAFDWRVSMAHVAADGPFSVFPGINRTLGVLSGAGLELAIEGSGLHRLTPASAPLSFPADAPTTARLLGGPITDLNVMTRRGVARHRLRRLAVVDRLAVTLSGRWTLLLVDAPCRVAAGGEALDLARGDALIEDGAGDLAITPLDGPMAAHAVEIDAAR